MELDPGMESVDQDSEVGVYSVTLTSPDVQPTQLRTVWPTWFVWRVPRT